MDLSIFEKIVSFCKRRGFFYPSCEIYGGLNGLYDRGPLACILEKNISNFWIKHMHLSEYDIVQFNGSILGHPEMWKASGHVEGFNDPLIDCKSCKIRYRTDEIDINKSCQRCGNKDWSESRQFNMMFSTTVGPVAESGSIAYLRPETAQSIFVQFKNILNTNRVKLPFGIMQVGKSFRNEITPRQFLFRLREFSQMEMEFFCKAEDADFFFNYWIERRKDFYKLIGFSEDQFKIRSHEKDELSHYSNATSDIEFLFPFGWKEIEGIAYRTDFDLKQHSKYSGKDLGVYDEEKKESCIPHVVECSVGVERLMFAVLCNAYKEEEVNEEIRTILKLKFEIAPIKVAVFPLTKNEDKLARDIYKKLVSEFSHCSFDDSGSIGKRYRRNDEIGTPFCVTVDSKSLEDNMITIRFRDSMKQERINISDLIEFIKLNKNTDF
jgi:glycyl-tRNA synthetase